MAPVCFPSSRVQPRPHPPYVRSSHLEAVARRAPEVPTAPFDYSKDTWRDVRSTLLRFAQEVK